MSNTRKRATVCQRGTPRTGLDWHSPVWLLLTCAPPPSKAAASCISLAATPSRVARAGGKRDRSESPEPYCRHGSLVVRICKNERNSGRSFLCCPLQRGDPDRCEHAFIWLGDTKVGKSARASASTKARSQTSGHSSSDASNRKGAQLRQTAVAVSAPVPRTGGLAVIQPAASAPVLFMVGRLRACNDRAETRVPADRTGHEGRRWQRPCGPCSDRSADSVDPPKWSLEWRGYRGFSFFVKTAIVLDPPNMNHQIHSHSA